MGRERRRAGGAAAYGPVGAYGRLRQAVRRLAIPGTALIFAVALLTRVLWPSLPLNLLAALLFAFALSAGYISLAFGYNLSRDQAPDD